MMRAIQELVEKMREPLGLDRWTHYIDIGEPAVAAATASCVASPEYKSAWLVFDPDKMRTGDDLGEIVAHELAHCPTWPLFKLAEDNAQLAVGMAPKFMRDALQTKLSEEARIAGEDVTTQVGFTFIRLMRRWWDAEDQLKKANAEVRSLRKQVREHERRQAGVVTAPSGI